MKAYAWTWQIQDTRGRWMTCKWAVSSRAVLEDDPKPSPEARAVRVELVPTRKAFRRDS